MINAPLLATQADWTDIENPLSGEFADSSLFAAYAGSKPVMATAGVPFEQDGFAWTSEFAGPGFDLAPVASIVWDDGEGPALYLGGFFRAAGPNAVNSIVRWNGSEWTSPDAGLDGTVTAFGTFNGELIAAVDRNEGTRVMRWDGNRWQPLGGAFESASPPVMPEATINDFTVYDGDLIAAGHFAAVDGQSSVRRVARWDGHRWQALGGGTQGPVNSVAVFDGQLYAGGAFAGGYFGISRWDGSSWQIDLDGPTGSVAVLVEFGGRLVVGGHFSGTGNDTSGWSLAEWDGAEWSILGGGVGSGESAAVHSLGLYQDQLVVGGYFGTVGGMTVNNLAAWNGTSWDALAGTQGTGFPNLIADGGRLLGLNEFQGSLIVSGAFRQAGGVGTNHISQWDGQDWSIPGGLTGRWDGLRFAVRDAVEFQDDLIVIAQLEWIGIERWGTHIARWDGEEFHPLGTGLLGTGFDAGNTMIVFEDDLIAGGTGLLQAGDVSIVNNIARWDGNEWSAMGQSFNNSTVWDFVVYEGDLYAAQGANIRRWNGVDWETVGDGSGGVNAARSMVVHDGYLVVIGSFTHMNGVQVNRIARWDGQEWSSMGGLSGSLIGGQIARNGSVGVYQGDLYAGGAFVQAAGVTVNGLARWDGSQWHPLGSGVNHWVRAIEEFDDRLIVGGTFTTVDGQPFAQIAAWDGSEWKPLAGPRAAGVDGAVWSLNSFQSTLGDDQVLVVGGQFVSAGGAGNWALAFYEALDLVVDPSVLSFGWLAVGETRGPVTLELSNASDVDITIDSISAPEPPFSGSGTTCPAAPFTLQPSASCELDFEFAPIEMGVFSDEIVISSDANAFGGIQSVPFTGRGTDTSLVVEPSTVDFGTVLLGGSGDEMTVTLTNAHPGTIEIAAIDDVQAPFVFTGGSCDNPPFELEPSSACTLVLGFTPLASGNYTQVIGITSDLPSTPDMLTLQGDGIVKELGVAPPFMNFGPVTLGDVSDPVTITLTNLGDSDLEIKIPMPPAPFRVHATDCSTVLPSEQTCIIDFVLAPTQIGSFQEQISILSDAPASPHNLFALGSGTGSIIDIAPSAMTVTVPVGGNDSASVTIENHGDVALDWNVIEVVDPLQGIIRTLSPGAPPFSTAPAFSERDETEARIMSASEAPSDRVFPVEYEPAATLAGITHSESLSIMAERSVACITPTGATTENHYFRVFNLAEFGILNDLEVMEVVFGIESLTTHTPITVNLYALEGAFLFENMTLLGSTTQILPPMMQTVFAMPVQGTVPVNTTLAVEIYAPDMGGAGRFFPGANNFGETAPSYIASPACGLFEPATIEDIGFDDIHLVMVVTGQVETPDCPNPNWLVIDSDSGQVPPGNSHTVEATLGHADLAAGIHETHVCIGSNDLMRPVAVVPTTLSVLDAPLASASPESLGLTAAAGATVSETLTIGNVGTALLEWTVGQADTPPVTVGQLAGTVEPILDDWTEGFEDVAGLEDHGWAFVNNSNPPPALPDFQGWAQGAPSEFPAHMGPSNSYAQDNFMSTFFGDGVISNWLITPEVLLMDGTTLRFWTRSLNPATADRLEVRMSTAGPSVDVGEEADSVGDFDLLLVSINEELAPGGYPQQWTEIVLNVEGLDHPTTGRFAFRTWTPQEWSPNTYVGVDTLSINQPPTGCDAPEDIAWLSAQPASGATAPGNFDDVQVVANTEGLATGEYEALVCVESNDPFDPILTVPVALSVTDPFPVYQSLPAPGVELDLGAVLTGSASLPLGIEVFNTGEGSPPGSDLLINSAVADHPAFEVTIADAGPFPAGQESINLPAIEITCVPAESGLVTGTLLVGTNDPEQPAGGFVYPLRCEGTDAAIEGTVRGTGYCDDDPGALVGAMVTIISTQDIYTTHTDQSGRFHQGLDPAEGPVDLEVSAPGHLDQAANGIELTAGQAVEWDIDLRANLGCTTHSPEFLSATLATGQHTILDLSLGNTGAGSAEFSVAGGDGPEWLAITPESGEIPGQSQFGIEVTLTAIPGLAPGTTLQTVLEITLDDGQGTFSAEIPVLLNVVDDGDTVFRDRFESGQGDAP